MTDDIRPTASERVVVAMSGGVDSSVTAALIAEQGYEVVGVTMNLSGSDSRCCSLADAEDARQVATRLGFRFFVANYSEPFHKEVVEAFADAYLAGRTPIPCVTCNTRFKFEYLLERAKLWNANRVATGHYARTERDPETGRYRLLRAVDERKDQTYFLFQLRQEQLARAWFPLGEMTKAEVREHARKLGLATADKPESQEICFVPNDDYVSVVESIRPEARALSGEIVDVEGRVLGQHRGVHRFTVGQRKGLGISSEVPLYVRRIEASTQRVVVAPLGGVEAREIEATGVSWISGLLPAEPEVAEVKVRHGHSGTRAKVVPTGPDSVRIQFEEPVRSPAPGQAAVFYREDEVLGGGWISQVPE